MVPFCAQEGTEAEVLRNGPDFIEVSAFALCKNNFVHHYKNLCLVLSSTLLKSTSPHGPYVVARAYTLSLLHLSRNQ